VDPISWNMYAYVIGDPVNRYDPSGLCDAVVGGITQDSSNSPEMVAFANAIGAMQAFPYAGGIAASGIADVVTGSAAATAVAYQGLLAALADPGDVSVFAFSGGATAFANAYAQLSPGQQGRIANITYVDPGGIGLLPAGSRSTTAILGIGWENAGVAAAVQLPNGTTIIRSDCLHDSNCEFTQNAQMLANRSGTACSQPSTFSRAVGAMELIVSTVAYGVGTYMSSGAWMASARAYWDIVTPRYLTASTIYYFSAESTISY
jgi:hypothetical protein